MRNTSAVTEWLIRVTNTAVMGVLALPRRATLTITLDSAEQPSPPPAGGTG